MQAIRFSGVERYVSLPEAKTKYVELFEQGQEVSLVRVGQTAEKSDIFLATDTEAEYINVQAERVACEKTHNPLMWIKDLDGRTVPSIPQEELMQEKGLAIIHKIKQALGIRELNVNENQEMSLSVMGITHTSQKDPDTFSFMRIT